MLRCCVFFNDTATTEIYTLSLHDALPIFALSGSNANLIERNQPIPEANDQGIWLDRSHSNRIEYNTTAHELVSLWEDRKSTRLNSSHANISYAVFCLKKQKPELAPAQCTA